MDWKLVSFLLLLQAAIAPWPVAAQGGTEGTAVSNASQAPFVTTLNINYTSTSATVRWVTDVPSDSQVEYGTVPGFGLASVADAALVASHVQTIIGLTANATYYLRVKSADASGNAGYSDAIEFSTPPNATAAAVPTAVGLDSSLDSTIAAGKPGESAVFNGRITNRGAEEVLNLTLKVIDAAGGPDISLTQPISPIPPFSTSPFALNATIAANASGSFRISFAFAGTTASGIPAYTAQMSATLSAITPQPEPPAPGPAPTLQAPSATPAATSQGPRIDALEKAALDIIARAQALNHTEIASSVQEALGLLSPSPSEGDIRRAESIIGQGRVQVEALERKKAEEGKAGKSQEPDALNYVTAMVLALAVFAALYWHFSKKGGQGPQTPIGPEPPQERISPPEIAYG